MKMELKDQTGISNDKRLIVVLLCFLFFALPFIVLYYPKVSALGVVQQNFVTQSCTNCAVAFLNNPVQNDFIIVQVTSSAATLPNSATTDTLGNTFTILKSDNTQLAVVLYIAQQTHTAGADTVTVHFAGVQTEVFISILEVNELSSVTPTVTSSGSGTTANPVSVGSITPNADNECFGALSVTGTGGAFAEPINGNPLNIDAQSTTNLAATNVGIGLKGINPLTAANTFQVSILKGGSATNTGSALATLSKSDYVVACLPTSIAGGSTTTTTTTTTSPTTTTASTTTTTTNGMSGGIVQEKNSSAITAATNSLTLDYKPQTNNLLLEITYCSPSSCSMNITKDNNGLTWHSLAGVTVLNGNVSVAMTVNYVNFTIASTKETITQQLTAASGSKLFQFRVFELTGVPVKSIGNFTQNTASGFSLSASVTSFTPPTNWIGFSFLYYDIGDNSAHTWNTSRFTEFNSNLSSMQNLMGTSNNWTLADYYPMWNLGATTGIITPNSATKKAWAELVIFLPTQISGIVTNTITSTTTTTTTTTTPTTTTTTSLTNSTTTTTSTLTSSSVTTITGTVIPEPPGSTDLLLILLAIIIYLILMIVGLIKRNPFPTLLGAIVLLIMNVGLYTNNQIVYGQNIISTPIWVNEMLTLLVVFSFILVIYQVAKRR